MLFRSDCISCGRCVGVCPSGAIDFAKFNMDSFAKIAKLYRGSLMLLVSEKNLDSLSDFEIPEHISPLVLPNINFLSELHLLTLLQESGGSMVLFFLDIPQNIKDSLDLINNIYEKVYAKKGIYIASSVEELKNIYSRVESISDSAYQYSHSKNSYKRSDFSERLRYVVKDKNYGIINGDYASFKYGKISIDAKKCTLCMACAESCNTKSLLSSSDSFTLKHNPSLCTACGYCVDSCPEKIMSFDSGVELDGRYFEYSILAEGEPFLCAECGKIFATKKSIEKIESVMKPHFLNDELKLKTIYCCSDCKVKVMFGDMA